MSAGEHPDTGELVRLTESIDRLADQMTLIGDTLVSIREDLNWLTRNPLRFEADSPQPSMAACTPACDFDVPGDCPELRETLNGLMRCLQGILTTTADQMAVLLSVLDEAQSHLAPLMRGSVREALHSQHSDQPTPAGPPADAKSAPPGRLF